MLEAFDAADAVIDAVRTITALNAGAAPALTSNGTAAPSWWPTKATRPRGEHHHLDRRG
jgi:hypothetical protein